MMKIIRQIVINDDKAIIYYLHDRSGSGGLGPSREVKKMTKMVSLEKLQASGALDLDQMEEDLR